MKLIKNIYCDPDSPLYRIIDIAYLLTPIGISHSKFSTGSGGFRTNKILYIFGIRLATWSTIKFE